MSKDEHSGGAEQARLLCRRWIMVKRDIEAYFEETVVPLIAREHPEVMAEMSVMVQGSIGSGIDDELSDLDVELYLPEKVWKKHGGQLMLTLLNKLEPFVAHPYSRPSWDPYDWHRFRHSEIAVNPLSQLLCGQAEAVLAGTRDVDWEAVAQENLLQLQIHPVLRDAHDALARLREATAPSRYPEWLWVKRLICELEDLLGEPEALEKAVRRGRPQEAQMILGHIVPGLFRVAFLVNRRYYPWRRCMLRLLKELPAGPAELLGDFEALGSAADWNEKCEAVNRIVRVLTKEILDSGMLTPDMLMFLLDAKRERAWESPDWMEKRRAGGRRAEEAGCDWLDGWIWSRWEWK